MTEGSDEIKRRSMTLWERVVRDFEYTIVLILTGLLMIVVAIATLELGWLLLGNLTSVRGLVLDAGEMFALFSFFLLIMIGIELLSALKLYVSEGTIHVEVVLEVALIALAQKLIVLNSTSLSALYLFALAALVLALAAAFWLVRTSRSRTT